MKRFEYKVPGGKLLRAKVEVEDEKIGFIQLTGDFFMQPETDLEELEARLIGCPTDAAAVEKAITGFFSAKRTVMAGACPADFAHVVNQAIKA